MDPLIRLCLVAFKTKDRASMFLRAFVRMSSLKGFYVHKDPRFTRGLIFLVHFF